jgi:hydroxymethylpyrimidine pyrophosphatase-like HAD family hydrolase
MRWKALATDFDGTLAHNGIVVEPAKQGLTRLREAGVKIILVTGRELADFAMLDIPLSTFDLVIAENGALFHDPRSGEVRGLGSPPPEHFVAELMRRGVQPLSVGASIIATVEPFEKDALELIKEMGLEHQVIFNKGAVMILPPGVNKATGLEVALAKLEIAPDDVVAVGDAENDHALLKMCGLAVAVENAIPSLKERADWVTVEPAGDGLAALMAAMLSGQLDHLGTPVEAKA